MKHIPTFENFVNESLNEATTEFDFDPTAYAKGSIEVKQDYDWLYGRKVGKNYTYTNKKIPNLSLQVSRWYEGKAPNNYSAFLSVPGSLSDGNSMNDKLGGLLKRSGSVSNSNGTSSFSFSSYELSVDELKSIIEKFCKQ